VLPIFSSLSKIEFVEVNQNKNKLKKSKS